MTKLVGICGHIGAGKSTLAKGLTDDGYRVASFATPLKRMLVALGLPLECLTDPALKEKPHQLLMMRTPRKAMQDLGDWGRQIHPDFWVNIAKMEYLAQEVNTVFDDVRFDNEANMIRGLGGAMIRVVRDCTLTVSGVPHISEKHWAGMVVGLDLRNETIDSALSKVHDYLESYQWGAK